jgi:hypothetical protein
MQPWSAVSFPESYNGDTHRLPVLRRRKIERSVRPTRHLLIDLADMPPSIWRRCWQKAVGRKKKHTHSRYQTHMHGCWLSLNGKSLFALAHFKFKSWQMERERCRVWEGWWSRDFPPDQRHLSVRIASRRSPDPRGIFIAILHSSKKHTKQVFYFISHAELQCSIFYTAIDWNEARIIINYYSQPKSKRILLIKKCNNLSVDTSFGF